MNQVKLIKFKQEDAEFVAQNFSEWFGNTDVDNIKNVIQKWQNGLGFCILCDGEKVGIISLSEKQDKKLSWGVMIKKEYRGMGIAQQAFELIKDKAVKAGYSIIISACAVKNMASKRLHEKVGFTLVSVEKNQAGNEMCRWQMEI